MLLQKRQTQPMAAPVGDGGRGTREGEGEGDRRQSYRLDFGKHKGKLLSECPDYYVQFLVDSRARFDGARYPGLRQGLSEFRRARHGSATPSLQQSASRGPSANPPQSRVRARPSANDGGGGGGGEAAMAGPTPPMTPHPVGPRRRLVMASPAGNPRPPPPRPPPPPPPHLLNAANTPPVPPHLPHAANSHLPNAANPPLLPPPPPRDGWFCWPKKRSAPDQGPPAKQGYVSPPPAPDQGPPAKRRCVSPPAEPEPHSQFYPHAQNTVVRYVDTGRHHAQLQELADRIRSDSHQAITRTAEHHKEQLRHAITRAAERRDEQFLDAVWDLGVLIKQVAAKTVTDTVTQMADLVHARKLEDENQRLQRRVHALSGATRATVGDPGADTDALQTHVGALETTSQEADNVAAGLRRQVLDLERAIRAATGDPSANEGTLRAYVERLQNQIHVLERAKQDDATTLEQARQAAAAAADDAQGLHTRINELEQANQAVEDHATQLAQELQTRLHKLDANETQRAALEKQVTELQAQLQKSEPELARHQKLAKAQNDALILAMNARKRVARPSGNHAGAHGLQSSGGGRDDDDDIGEGSSSGPSQPVPPGLSGEMAQAIFEHVRHGQPMPTTPLDLD
ncbi:hypothetical protein BDU57DRAFT_543607 [Ampelomyces quisqualis]|uniref:Uncharacterized protein n=1 Tax=Ampelomyces quisqualis TaxID=50730 RepID=A0A6A5Q837_AMPQU|nr:hypothetical protein BDU57DRAFT_543607 [Ampelomyces quisqualis]